MPMTVAVTRDVAARYRGFLASCMLEIAPGTYVSPSMNAGVRERVWGVLADWWRELPGGSLILLWRDGRSSGGVGVLTLGTPPIELVDVDGLKLALRRPMG